MPDGVERPPVEDSLLWRRVAAAIGGPVPAEPLGRLLRVALTHASVANEAGPAPGGEDNERLEFLGDAVLGLAVAEALHGLQPDLAPGELTRLRAAVVSGEALAEAGAALELGPLLRLGRGEELDGGRSRPSNLGRAFEAALGAVHLGAGYPAAAHLARQALLGRLAAAIEGTAGRDAKSTLQELAQAERTLPRYEVLAHEGPDHAPTWRVRVTLQGTSAEAAAGSRRQAEQDAASRLLSMLGWLRDGGDRPRA